LDVVADAALVSGPLVIGQCNCLSNCHVQLVPLHVLHMVGSIFICPGLVHPYRATPPTGFTDSYVTASPFLGLYAVHTPLLPVPLTTAPYQVSRGWQEVCEP